MYEGSMTVRKKTLQFAYTIRQSNPLVDPFYSWRGRGPELVGDQDVCTIRAGLWTATNRLYPSGMRVSPLPCIEQVLTPRGNALFPVDGLVVTASIARLVLTALTFNYLDE